MVTWRHPSCDHRPALSGLL